MITILQGDTQVPDAVYRYRHPVRDYFRQQVNLQKTLSIPKSGRHPTCLYAGGV